MKRAVGIAVALLLAQAGLVGIWYLVEGGREPSPAPLGNITAPGATTRPNRPAPELELVRVDGSVVELSDLRGQPLVLHVWATWCPPCRDELPSLLDFAAEGQLTVLAVSVDSDWDTVRAFVGEPLPDGLALAESQQISSGFDIDVLPVTFVLDDAGLIRLRFEGPREWALPEVRARVQAATGL